MVFSVASPLLDACVLALLGREDAYGYAMTQALRQRVDISESTLYPILRRLQQEGALKTYDRPYQGRNRRYYAITPVGESMLAAYRQEWTKYRENVETLLFAGKGGPGHEQ